MKSGFTLTKAQQKNFLQLSAHNINRTIERISTAYNMKEKSSCNQGQFGADVKITKKGKSAFLAADLPFFWHV